MPSDICRPEFPPQQLLHCARLINGAFCLKAALSTGVFLIGGSVLLSKKLRPLLKFRSETLKTIMNRFFLLAGRYFNVFLLKIIFFFINPFSRVTYDRKNDFLNVEA